ncbi:FAD:protein FMN transferase [Hydrogenophaga laconesensis]|uniref:FAD:protein FMN transferase n=1 Tax=Hydrogenophaga laconesensis TaxID=1805971 RepID=A0ABU1V9R7_9BURK|nr:FAD:protein FMN transferase [Hydrogenophaga laconesensis]MDR7094209.1 thiamine biosynthesis lipoprotein [Hydrogenophaga laconesensis]
MTRVLVPLQLDDSMPLLAAQAHRLEGQTMGTTWQVLWATTGPSQGQAVRVAVQDELDLVVAQMSTWLAGSDVDRFNRAAAGTLHTVPEAMAAVLDAALWMAHVSDGAFNPAAGALVNLWGFGPGPRYTDPGFEPPSEGAVLGALALKDWRALAWNATTREARQPGAVLLDFSAIAKGYAVDRVSRRLAGMGLAHHLVEVGGELRGSGLRPGGQPWWVDLESPPVASGPSALQTTRVALHSMAVATSGDYRRVYTRDGVRWPHTIDPRNGRPLSNGLASVSVLHAECMWADAWSTALTVLGRDEGLALATAHGIAALFVQRGADGRLAETLTPAMKELAA